ncbi:MAG: hypothetical protein ABEN55_13540 [Bradymonadaceae bacterium]
MGRLTLATLAFISALFWTTGASAQVDPCTADSGDVICPKERYQLLRDKARVGQLLCEALDTGSLSATLPTRLQAVCESADLTSRIWADAQTKEKHAAAAREAQRKANRFRGQLVEVRTVADRYERQRDKARGKVRVWKIVAGGTTVAAVVSTGLILLDRVGVVDLTPGQFR